MLSYLVTKTFFISCILRKESYSWLQLYIYMVAFITVLTFCILSLLPISFILDLRDCMKQVHETHDKCNVNLSTLNYFIRTHELVYRPSVSLPFDDAPFAR